MSGIAGQFQLTPELLGLSDITISDIHEARDGSICVTVKSTQTETLCRHCKSPTELYGRGRTLTFGLLSILVREVYIKITPPRGIVTLRQDCVKSYYRPATGSVM
jgi:hypothetical protein